MLKVVAATALAIPAALVGLAAGTGVMVVDVKPADGPRIVVPVPLALAQAAAAFVPGHAMQIPAEEVAELRQHLPAIQGILQALAEAPDAELVRVEERNGHVVSVTKRGDLVEVLVDGAREHVEATVPLALVERALEMLADGRMRPAALIGELRRQRWTDLVEVHDGGDHVRVWLF